MQSQWERITYQDSDREKVWAKSRSFAQDVWFRFRRKPTALGGLIIIALLLIFALVGPVLSPYGYSQQDLSMANISPILNVYPAGDGVYFYLNAAQKLIQVDGSGHLVRQLEKVEENFDERWYAFSYGDEGQLVYLDFTVKPYAVKLSQYGEQIQADARLWNRTYLLGTDHLGRDILTRLMYGTRISLMVAFIAALVNMVIGILYGSLSGYIGGRADAVMMRIVDIISTIPLTLYVILIKVCLDNGMVSIILALSSVYWVDMARVVRGQVLSLKQQEFVLAARTIGSSTGMIIREHLIPNAMGSVLVTVTMLIPSAIFMESFMSFIGIGIAPPMASLGTMCTDAVESLRTAPYQLLMPAVVICLIMFAFNFVGDGLRDALDPKLKK